MTMLKTLPLLLCALIFASPALAQDDAPEADPSDVASVDAILTALYDVISGPAGPRDWDRMRSLFTPTSRLTPTGQDSVGEAVYRTFTLEEYIETVGDFFAQSPFFEVEIARKTDSYGNVVHAFSTYESYFSMDDEEPFQRGINSIQLLFSQGRWWIHSIAWQPERDDLPIPHAYLPELP